MNTQGTTDSSWGLRNHRGLSPTGKPLLLSFPKTWPARAPLGLSLHSSREHSSLQNLLSSCFQPLSPGDRLREQMQFLKQSHRQLCVLPPVLGSEGTASISPFLPVAPRFSKVAANSELANADSHCSWGNPRLGSQEPLVTTSLVNNLMSGYQMSV
jgi:hypothetical protein